MNTTTQTASDYAYYLPDHWIMPKDNPFAAMHDAYVARVVQLLTAHGCRRVLELGCGDGWNCGRMVDAGLNVTGNDWSERGIAYAQMMVPAARFVCGDAREPAIASELDGPFDGVALVEVIEHVPPEDCNTVMLQAFDLLKPGGIFVLTTPSTNFPNNNHQHYRHFDEPMLRGLFEIAGFNVTLVEGYGDVRAERRYWALSRLVDNRLWQVKPARRWLLDRYRNHVSDTPKDRCHGWIVVGVRP